MDGRAYLEKLISDRLREARAQPDAVRGASVNLPEIRGIATGLVAARALAQPDADRLLTDLRSTMARAGWLAETTPGTARRPGQGEAESGERKADSPELLRVVPLLGHTIQHGAITRTLISLEVWSGVLVVRSAIRQDTWEPGVLNRFHDSRWHWRAWDDHGTQYRSTGVAAGGPSGTGDLLFENRAFYPSPPDEAEVLTLVAEHPEHQAAVELPLR